MALARAKNGSSGIQWIVLNLSSMAVVVSTAHAEHRHKRQADRSVPPGQPRILGHQEPGPTDFEV